ncbi:MAG: PAS domain S-box protein [Acidobacteriota bacterium]|nr:PAS domain S-box protein [Acidobacteriota bacterium]
MSEELSKFLRESEERYRTVVEAASDAILSVKENGVIIFANPAVEKIFGYKVFEIVGQNLSVLVPENTLEKFLQKLSSRIKSGDGNFTSLQIETPAVRRDGSIFPLEISFAESRQNGEPCFIGIARDISDRIQTEESLVESQMMLALAMRSSRIGAWEQDLATDTVNWNSELEKIFGLENGEFNQTTAEFYKLVHEADRERIWGEVQQAIAEKREYQIEFRFHHSDGGIRWMEGRGQAVYSQKGEPVRLYGIGMDISERKKAEEISARYRLLSKRARDIILFLRPDGKIVDANQAAVDSYGYDDETLVQMNLSDLRSPETVGLLQSHLKKADETGIQFETIHRRKDGSDFSVEVSSIGADVGGERLLISIIRDVSDRKSADIERENLLEREQIARREAEAANRSKDEFLSVLSHELRTPLNAILGWTTMLKTDLLDEARKTQAIATIERNALLQNNLIEDLLDVSRIISGNIRLETAKIDLAVVVKSAFETIRPLAGAKNISLEIENPDLTLEINGDATRLQQIVVNLANNAVKFTPSSGAIVIALSKRDEMARMEITDTGIGISPEFLPHIFDRFRQADSTTQRHHSGLGLGLTIVRHLTELHNGRVFADSDGKGKGASFAVEIPLIVDQNDEKDYAEIKTPANNHQIDKNILLGKTILLVDDDCEGIQPLKLFLENHGADIDCVESAAEALKKLAEADFDLILSDIGMPEMDGYQFIEKARSAPINSSVPAIALTAFASAEDRRRALTAGFMTHVSKPINFDELLRVIIKIFAENGNK